MEFYNKWVDTLWWKYVFSSYHPEWRKRPYVWPGWRRIFCRARGHPDGPIFFSTMGTEPDMRCSNCDEDIG